MNLVFDNCTEAYLGLAGLIRDNYEYESSPRGQKVKECLGVRFEITNPLDRIPYIPVRKFSMQYMIAEMLWYFSAEDKTAWIANYAPFWDKISDDGLTANSAYGARLFKRNIKIAGGRINQWLYVKGELEKDPDSRRAIMHIRVPSDSIDANLDVPCTLALQFFIRDGKLDLMVNMRSSDLILGIAYDIPAFTMFQEAMALELGIPVGRYIHVSNSLHVYEKHFEMLDEIVTQAPQARLCHSRRGPMNPMPKKLNIEALYDFEEKIRTLETKESIIEFLNSDDMNLNKYEQSWIEILAAHRAKKIGEKDLAKDIMGNVPKQLQPIRGL